MAAPDLNKLRDLVRTGRPPAPIPPPQATIPTDTPSLNARLSEWCDDHNEALTAGLFLAALIIGLIHGLAHNEVVPSLIVAFFGGAYGTRFIVWLAGFFAIGAIILTVFFALIALRAIIT